MAIQMTGLCQKGVDLIWKQCNEELFPEGLEDLREAAREGDPEAFFFLGHCYSWGDGDVGFNEKKAYECYREGARAGSYRCVLGALRAGQYDSDMKEEAKYTLEECLDEVRRAAKEGDAFAAYQLARALEWEDIFDLLPREERRAAECLSWYETAAGDGIVDAMVKAGKCYLTGRFAAKNVKKALEFADRSAALGHPWGLYHMGLYHRENGNDEAAFEYFRAASAQGDPDAPLELGKMYLEGRGTERSVELAVEALEAAAARENKECLALLGAIFYEDRVVERDDEKAFYWYRLAAAAGDGRALLPLGRLYLCPSERQDYQKAFALLEEAAAQDRDGSANLALGNLCRGGIGCEPDLDRAIACYETGARMGNPECMEILGDLYFQEDSSARDYEKAFFWLERCLKEGTLQSYSKLAFLYLRGLGCEADEAQAEELFLQAAQRECDGYAFFELGGIYERRNRSQEDLETAAGYYEKAIEMGDEGAMERFSHFRRTVFGNWKVMD